MSATIPVSFQDDQVDVIRSAAERTGLSQQDVIRQATNLGIGPLVEKLSAQAGRITNVDPLPDKVLDRLYQERDDDPEGIDALMAAQPIGKPE